MAKKCIETPMTGVPPVKKTGGAGTYNGEKGYPSRTSTPNGPSEKVRDGK